MKDVAIFFETLIQKIQRSSGRYADLSQIEGLTTAELEALVQHLQVDFPDFYKEALKIYGKTIEDKNYAGYILDFPVFGQMGLMTEKQILAVYDLLSRANLDNVPVEHTVVGLPKVSWHKQWIPVAAYANWTIHSELSNYDMLILDDKSDFFGHILYWNQKPIQWLGQSFEAYLKDFSRALQSPLISWDASYGFSF